MYWSTKYSRKLQMVLSTHCLVTITVKNIWVIISVVRNQIKDEQGPWHIQISLFCGLCVWVYTDDNAVAVIQKSYGLQCEEGCLTTHNCRDQMTDDTSESE